MGLQNISDFDPDYSQNIQGEDINEMSVYTQDPPPYARSTYTYAQEPDLYDVSGQVDQTLDIDPEGRGLVDGEDLQ